MQWKEEGAFLVNMAQPAWAGKRRGSEGSIKIVGHGTLWSAAASEARRRFGLCFVSDQPLNPKRRRASLAAALHIDRLLVAPGERVWNPSTASAADVRRRNFVQSAYFARILTSAANRQL